MYDRVPSWLRVDGTRLAIHSEKLLDGLHDVLSGQSWCTSVGKTVNLMISQQQNEAPADCRNKASV
jgi:hypothetical protein